MNHFTPDFLGREFTYGHLLDILQNMQLVTNIIPFINTKKIRNFMIQSNNHFRKYFFHIGIQMKMDSLIDK